MFDKHTLHIEDFGTSLNSKEWKKRVFENKEESLSKCFVARQRTRKKNNAQTSRSSLKSKFKENNKCFDFTNEIY